MSETEVQPRAYRRPVSTWWWLEKRSYFVFAMRELSSVFVAWFVVFLLMLTYAVGRGDDQYQSFLDWAATPWVVVLNLVTLVFVVLHMVTWFNLTPQATVVRLRGQRVPAWAIIASQYVGLAVVSAFVIWLVTR
ncbi:MAG: fumarate reductase subunit C [Propionibacteriales bacterium]|nr:fumarate reductase subunit C [Propionibacteriales bacterium]